MKEDVRQRRLLRGDERDGEDVAVEHKEDGDDRVSDRRDEQRAHRLGTQGEKGLKWTTRLAVSRRNSSSRSDASSTVSTLAMPARHRAAATWDAAPASATPTRQPARAR